MLTLKFGQLMFSVNRCSQKGELSFRPQIMARKLHEVYGREFLAE